MRTATTFRLHADDDDAHDFNDFNDIVRELVKISL